MFSTANLAARSADISPRVERRMVVAVFFVSLALIAVSKWGQWHEIPYWDAAFSVFPAAIVLAESDFDYSTLLSAPGFAEGGPNVHANSSLALLVATILMIVPDAEDAFLILHWFNYAIAALTVTLLYLWSLPLVGRSCAIGVAMATLIFPLFLTQAGHMYLELPSACVALFALSSFHAGRTTQASLWALLAASIKEPGIIVAVTLAGVAMIHAGPFKRRLVRTVVIGIPASLFVAGQMVLHSKTVNLARPTFLEYLQHAWKNFIQVPDVLVVALTAAVVVTFGAVFVVRTLRSAPQPVAHEGDANHRRALTYLIVAFFVAFYLTVPFVGTVYLLPRYVIPVFPLMILIVADASVRMFGRRMTTLCLILFCGVSIINANGRFYPFSPGNNGSDAERSGEYVQLLAAHRDAMAAAQELPFDIPIFHGLPEHYFSQYPLMGYVRVPLKNAHCIMLEPRYSSADLETFPDHFYLLYSFGALGGDKLNWLKTQALANPEYAVSQSIFRHGHYQAQLIEVRRTKLPSPSPSTVTQ